MKDYFPFATSSGNSYCFHRERGTLLYCQPLLYQAIVLHRKGQLADEWFGYLLENDTDSASAQSARANAELAYRKFCLLRQDGFFSEISEQETLRALSAKLSPNDVQSALATTPQVVFELTERCNLKCDYCYYGPHYVQATPRSNRDLTFEAARALLDYIAQLSETSCGKGGSREIQIAFYGGEPLLMVPLLQQIVAHALATFGARAKFQISTNGLLLPMCWDFLFQNDFGLQISLDGDEDCSVYRRYRNGAPAYDCVVRNVRALRERHPSYFERRVSFNAVLTDRKSVSAVREFFLREFDKTPEMTTPMYRNLKTTDSAEWIGVAGNTGSTEACNNHKEEWQRKELDTLLTSMLAEGFLRRYAPRHQLRDLSEAALPKSWAVTPSGVCLPFSNEVFLTARGEILPCEQIDRCHALGRISGGRVEIDFDKVAALYNRYFEQLTSTCVSCQRALDCSECMFMLDLNQSCVRCPHVSSEAEYMQMLSDIVGYLEHNHSEVPEVL